MRRWILRIVLVTFTWGQVAQAYPQSDVPALKNFLQKTGWTKKDVKLRDIYEQTKHTLPLDFRFEIERMLERHPNMMLPKLEVRMIKNGRFEDVQLIAQKGRQAATATLSYRGDLVGEITYPHGGKNIQKKLMMADLYNPVRMMAEAYGPGVGVADRIQFTRLLREKELALLRPQDRQNYSEQVREVLRLAEKAQGKINGKKDVPAVKRKEPTKTSMAPWLDLVLPEAHASTTGPTGSCLVLGWIGTFQNGKCMPPNEAKDPTKCPGSYSCSKILYGANAECGTITFEKGAANSSAEICNMRNKDNKYDFFKGAKTQEDFDKKFDELSLKLNEIRELCTRPVNEQINECKDLETRMAELKAVNCEVLTKWKEQFYDLKCNATAPAAIARADSVSNPTPGADIAPPVTIPIPDEGAGTDGGTGQEEGVTIAYKDPPMETAPPQQYDQQPPPQQNTGNPGVHCEGLPLQQSALDCAGGSIGSIVCNSQNENRTHYYCICSGGLREKFSRSAKAIACESERREVTRDRDRDRYTRRPTRERPQKSWWDQNGGFQGMLGGVLTVGVGILGYYMQQQQLKQQWEAYYNMYQPQQLRIAPPPTGTPIIINPLNPTVPVMPGTR